MLIVVKTGAMYRPSAMQERHEELLGQAEKGLLFLRPNEEVHVYCSDSAEIPAVRLEPEEDAHGTV